MTKPAKMPKYTIDELKRKLGDRGWRTIRSSIIHTREGTLGELAETAHARHKSGQAAGYLQEVDTEIKVDMLQLEELWQHMGLPTI